MEFFKMRKFRKAHKRNLEKGPDNNLVYVSGPEKPKKENVNDLQSQFNPTRNLDFKSK